MDLWVFRRSLFSVSLLSQRENLMLPRHLVCEDEIENDRTESKTISSLWQKATWYHLWKDRVVHVFWQEVTGGSPNMITPALICNCILFLCSTLSAPHMGPWAHNLLDLIWIKTVFKGHKIHFKVCLSQLFLAKPCFLLHVHIEALCKTIWQQRDTHIQKLLHHLIMQQ